LLVLGAGYDPLKPPLPSLAKKLQRHKPAKLLLSSARRLLDLILDGTTIYLFLWQYFFNSRFFTADLAAAQILTAVGAGF
jgi:hypothetical protein